MEALNISTLNSSFTMSTAAILASGNGLLLSPPSSAGGSSSGGPGSAAASVTDLTNDNKPIIEINTYLYIPFIIFVFGAPLLFIGFLCFLQHRSKQLHRREWERLNNRRLSTQSGIYTGRASTIQACREECL